MAEFHSLVDVRCEYLRSYEPPSMKTDAVDPMTGDPQVIPIVQSVNVVFFGPVGSGKSSLIGSLCRAISDWPDFPDTVKRSLRSEPTGSTVAFPQPQYVENNTDEHGTLSFVETKANDRGTIVFQDTKGDQDYDHSERLVHAQEMQGYFRDGSDIGMYSALSSSWWQQRFAWQRTINHMPHGVVFVFNGSQVPFFAGESRDFFIRVFADCKKAGYEPMVVVTFLDQIHERCRMEGRNFDIVKQEKMDIILAAFDRFNLPASHIMLVTNFHDNSTGRFWSVADGEDQFRAANRQFVDLAREVVKLCERFLDKAKYQAPCVLL